MIGFYLARAAGNDAALAAYSRPLPSLAGQRVALVGNARSLGEKSLGADIDGHDMVVRMNAAPMPTPASHGRRTDWHAMSIPVPAAVVAEKSAERVLWMTSKRKRLPRWLALGGKLYLHPLEESSALQQRLGARPSTGALLIDLLARSDASAVTLYGFDFFASLSLSGRRTAEQTPHDFAAERDWATALMAADPRVTLAS